MVIAIGLAACWWSQSTVAHGVLHQQRTHTKVPVGLLLCLPSRVMLSAATVPGLLSCNPPGLCQCCKKCFGDGAAIMGIAIVLAGCCWSQSTVAHGDLHEQQRTHTRVAVRASLSAVRRRALPRILLRPCVRFRGRAWRALVSRAAVPPGLCAVLSCLAAPIIHEASCESLPVHVCSCACELSCTSGIPVYSRTTHRRCYSILWDCLRSCCGHARTLS
jgi:hypothetical protein